jgi:hypothetical protein
MSKKTNVIKLKAKAKKPRRRRHHNGGMREHPRGIYGSGPIFSDKQLGDFLLGTVADHLLMSFFRQSGLRKALVEHLAKNPPDEVDAEFVDDKPEKVQ